MPTVSVILPVFNVEHYVGQAVASVLNQTYSDFELLVVDDGSTDASLAVCGRFRDDRIRVIRQANRGLAGARNTGIRHARGGYIAFLDADDLWLPAKLEAHVMHLRTRKEVGVSYSQSSFIDEHGMPMRYHQMPKLYGVSASDILLRNPVGNGSAAVVRRAAFADIRFLVGPFGDTRDCYFDETFRQSEDVECWLRIALQTHWQFEGIGQPLTLYRVNAHGLSANLAKQLQSWERFIEKTRSYAPHFISRWGTLARAFQLRYLARRAVRQGDASAARRLFHQAIVSDYRMVVREPMRTAVTGAAIYLQSLLPRHWYSRLESLSMTLGGRYQRRASSTDVS